MMALLIVAILVVAFAPMVAEARRKEFTFFNPKNPFIVYYTFELALSALVTMAIGSVPSTGLDYDANHASYVEALWIALLGIAAFQLGYYATRTRGLSVPRFMTRPWRLDRSRLVGSACLSIGTTAFMLLMVKNGGLSAFLESRESWRAGGLTGQGVLLFPATTVMALGAHIIFLAHVGPMTSWRRLSVLLCVYIVALVPPYFLGFRSLLAVPLLQLLVLWNVRRRAIPGTLLFLTLSVFAAGFTGYGLVRELPPNVALSGPSVASLIKARPDLALAVVARTRGVEVLATVVHRLHQTEEFDYSLKSPFEAVSIFIPGSIWKSKPLSTGERFTTYFFGDDFVYARGVNNATFGGVSPTITGEFYWHLGIAGVVAGLFLLGVCARVVYATMRRHSRSPGVTLCYAVLFTTIALMAESFQGYLNTLVLVSLTVGPLLVMLGQPMRHRTALPPPAGLASAGHK